jgi:phospholipid/cholesterol/gamma-HCH transport system permease protein
MSQAAIPAAASPARLEFETPEAGTLRMRLSGDWCIREHLPPAAEAERQVEGTPRLRRLTFEGSGVSDWDSGLLTFVVRIARACQARGVAIDTSGLPQGVGELQRLAFAVPEKKDTGRSAEKLPLLERVGRAALTARDEVVAFAAFLGDSIIALGRFARGRARYRRSDLWLFVEDCGAQALGIVSLISFLVGMILAFVGAQQLRLFGAEIYVADLVAIGMARVMGAMMAAIVMAGRTGAAFAAQLGTMTVNEEIDALKTLGIPPMEFLVLPRMLALVLMMPLLTVYADLMGILGGAVVGVGLLDITLPQYWEQTVHALNVQHFLVGLVQAGAFGVLIAMAGCMRGMESGRSSSAVGAAATSAVVTGIVLIVVSLALFTVLFDALGI